MNKQSNFKYKILPRLNLIVDSYFGNLTIDEILLYKSNQTKDPLWNPGYNTLADMRNSNTIIDEDEIERLSKYQVSDNRWSEKRQTASLTDEANHIVFEELFNMLKPKDSKVLVRAFSTLDAAILWLGIDKSEKPCINEVLNELNKK